MALILKNFEKSSLLSLSLPPFLSLLGNDFLCFMLFVHVCLYDCVCVCVCMCVCVCGQVTLNNIEVTVENVKKLAQELDVS